MLAIKTLGDMPLAGFPGSVSATTITETAASSDTFSPLHYIFKTISDLVDAADSTTYTINLGPNHFGRKVRLVFGARGRE